jgi:hypothetical protein
MDFAVALNHNDSTAISKKRRMQTNQQMCKRHSKRDTRVKW